MFKLSHNMMPPLRVSTGTRKHVENIDTNCGKREIKKAIRKTIMPAKDS